jgi:subtilase family serine protease
VRSGALEDPKAANYFNGNWVANGKGKNLGHVANVGELIDYMSKKGLRFAPAVAGEADAYRALYHALQAFDAGMTTVASSGDKGDNGNGGNANNQQDEP